MRQNPSVASKYRPVPDTTKYLKNTINIDFTEDEIKAIKILEKSRPPALRSYDQIPMLGEDMLRQIKIIGPYINNTKTVFIGDNDGASTLLGLLSVLGYPCPQEMLVIDFDERILRNIVKVAMRFGFRDKIKILHYNVFDKIPSEYIGHYDWYYTNPPYGSHNQGESARLFISRGSEFVKPNGKGCIILPDDDEHPWTRSAMWATQKFLTNHGWEVGEKVNRMHHYYLDEDLELTSSFMLTANIITDNSIIKPMPYIGRKVDFAEIPYFYGKSVSPPYPHYILANGMENYNWTD